MATTNTRTIKTSGGDYTSLSAWEAGRQGNLVTSDYIEVAECYSMSDTTLCTINGWTTDATRYIKIYTPASERHAGIYSTSKYRMEGADRRLYIAGASDVWIQGLQVYQSSVTDSVGAIEITLGTTVGRIKVEACIIRGISNADNTHTGIQATSGGAASTLTAWNNIVYDFLGTYGIGIRNKPANFTTYAYNNTVVDCGFGCFYVDAGSMVPKNNIGQGTSSEGNYYGSFSSSATNISEDASSPDVAFRSLAVTFNNEAGDDFHLGSGDTAAKDAGTSDPGAGLFSDDIDGVTRAGAWDIGADEYVAAVTGNPWYAYAQQ